jgi:hypothetical protein
MTPRATTGCPAAPAARQIGDEEVSQQPEQDEVSRMDDFEVIRERQDVMQALAALTDRYRRLNREMTSRKTLQWMVPQ